MNCALYLRYSPRPQQQCESIEFQESYCRKYLEFLGIEVGGKFADPDTSARKLPLRKRAGGKLLLEATTGPSPRYNMVCCYRLDRLWRDVVDGNLTLRQWRRWGVDCHFAAEGGCSINTSTATGRFLINILLSKASYEPDLTSERTSSAMQRYIAGGKAMGGSPPYGKRRVGREWVDDPAEQAVIARVLELHAAGLKNQQIASLLNRECVPSRGESWSHVTIRRIIARSRSVQTSAVAGGAG